MNTYLRVLLLGCILVLSACKEEKFQIAEYSVLPIPIEINEVTATKNLDFYTKINSLGRFDQRESGIMVSYRLVLDEFRWDDRIHIIPGSSNASHAQSDGFNIVVLPSEVTYYKKNEYLGFTMKMEFGIATSSLRVQKIFYTDGHPFSTRKMISFVEDETLDTLKSNVNGTRILDTGNWIKFTRIIIGENSEEGLTIKTLSPILEEDFNKLENVFPPGAYSITDRSIPPEKISVTTVATKGL